MKIIENPKSKLESVDLIDEKGALLRITNDTLLEMEYNENSDLKTRAFNQLFSNFEGNVIPKHQELYFKVKFLDHALTFHFIGEEAVKIAESLYKLKGY